MRKIPTLLERDPHNRSKVIFGAVTPGCEWVLAGEGLPTRKFDGTCCAYAAPSNLSLEGQTAYVTGADELAGDPSWWARREVKAGRPVPDRFIPVEHDEVTGKTFGWEPVELSSYAKYHRQALAADPDKIYTPGTYELVGPKVQGNPDGFDRHTLVRHGQQVVADLVGVGDLGTIVSAVIEMRHAGLEGVVWHHEDGRMAKLKVRDVVR